MSGVTNVEGLGESNKEEESNRSRKVPEFAEEGTFGKN